MNIRNLQEGDLEQLFDIRRVAYLMNDVLTDEMRRLQISRLPFIRGVFEGQKLMSAATFFPFEMYFAGNTLPVGGLAGVLTAPEARRRGYVKALLKDGL